MVVSKKISLKPILESNSGLHLTCYIPKSTNALETKIQIKKMADEARSYLKAILSNDLIEKFLAPLIKISESEKHLVHMKGNLGFFRDWSSFRVINLPKPVEPLCVVATSYHVKPLLEWMQSDQEFLLLGVDENHYHLYFANRTQVQHVDSVKTLEEVSDWVKEVTKYIQPRLFVIGHPELTSKVGQSIKYKKLFKPFLDQEFHINSISAHCDDVRDVLSYEVQLRIKKAILEYNKASDANLTRNNIFQIAKAATAGRVKKLIVSRDIKIFGQLNKTTGGVAIHHAHLNHEDDDLLDDLAQLVLAKGGEVIVAPQNDIPKGRPALAILKKKESSNEEKVLHSA